jgi:hypothetical protein
MSKPTQLHIHTYIHTYIHTSQQAQAQRLAKPEGLQHGIQSPQQQSANGAQTHQNAGQPGQPGQPGFFLPNPTDIDAAPGRSEAEKLLNAFATGAKTGGSDGAQRAIAYNMPPNSPPQAKTAGQSSDSKTPNGGSAETTNNNNNNNNNRTPPSGQNQPQQNNSKPVVGAPAPPPPPVIIQRLQSTNMSRSISKEKPSLPGKPEMPKGDAGRLQPVGPEILHDGSKRQA